MSEAALKASKQAMAQTMLLTSSVSSTYSAKLNRDSLLYMQTHTLRPKFSQLLYNPLPSPSTSFPFSSSSRSFTTQALFKFKTKAPPKVNKASTKVIFLEFVCRIRYYFFLTLELTSFDLYRLQIPSQRLKMVSLAPLVALVLPRRTSSLLVALP